MMDGIESERLRALLLSNPESSTWEGRCNCCLEVLDDERTAASSARGVMRDDEMETSTSYQSQTRAFQAEIRFRARQSRKFW
jgi:hypothetical protein